jgi:predicted CopG family antitoxin
MPRHGYKSITVPEQIYNRLNDVRRRERLASLSDVISYLLASYELGIKDNLTPIVALNVNVDATKDSVNNYVKELRRRLGLDK